MGSVFGLAIELQLYTGLCLSLLRSMLLSTSLCFLCAKFLKDVNTPAEGVVVSLATVELVESLEFCVGDGEVCVY